MRAVTSAEVLFLLNDVNLRQFGSAMPGPVMGLAVSWLEAGMALS